ncbi:MAG: ABC transporter permease [Actinobacteria bacterium]|nr:ABC transporter permease [Actinomycetota bacterium]
MAATAAVTERTSEPPKLRIIPRVREIVACREILANLVRKELKVKYTASVLGAVWSLLNPVVFLAVFTFVTVVLGNNIPSFPVFLLSGLLAWNLFSVALGLGARSVVDNANLVKKVSFPREILPLSTVGVSLVDFALQSSVLLLFMLVTGFGFRASSLLLYPLAFVDLVVFTVAMVLWISALNVRYRDIQHLTGLALLVWFWLTPIVYPGALVQAKLTSFHGFDAWNVFLLNPLADIVFGFQRALYATVSPNGRAVLPPVSTAWLAGLLLAVLCASLLLLSLTWRLFFRMSGDFAEEL